jgi:Glycosyltransferase 61
MLQTVKLPAYRTGRDWLIGAPSKLADRIIPVPEEIWLPHAETTPGYMTLEWPGAARDESIARVRSAGTYRSKIKAIVRCGNGIQTSPDLILDLRVNSPSNWAHAFTNHLPVALLANLHKDPIKEQLRILLPRDVPQMIVDLFEASGFSTLRTDSSVRGRICSVNVHPWTAIRGIRHEVIRTGLHDTELHRLIEENDDWPSHIFIGRRGKRSVRNQRSLQSVLEDIGYTTVYTEDFSLIDQISLIYHARKIIAVHGASLGPVIFKALSKDIPYKLMEIFSPAHVTNVYRVLAHQTSGSWIGVRGKVWPALLSKRADFSANMEDFELSEESLELGLLRIAE